MKQKRLYEQPRTEVVELRVTNQLLAGSVQGDRNNPYGDPEEWPTV